MDVIMVWMCDLHTDSGFAFYIILLLILISSSTVTWQMFLSRRLTIADVAAAAVNLNSSLFISLLNIKFNISM